MRIIENIIDRIREAIFGQHQQLAKQNPYEKLIEHSRPSDYAWDERTTTNYDYTLDPTFAEALMEEPIPDFSSDPIIPKKGTKQANLLNLLNDYESVTAWFIGHKLKTTRTAAHQLVLQLRKRGHNIEYVDGAYRLVG